MRVGAVALLLLSAVLSSCDKTRPHESSLQRYDELRPWLQEVAAGSRKVAMEEAAMQRAMQADDSRRTRQETRALQFDALLFARRVGYVANQIRRLLPGQRGRVRQYYRWVIEALSAQWAEGGTLAKLATLIASDPLLMNGKVAARVERLAAQARSEARTSVLLAQRAERWKRRHRADFRYVPVTPGTAGKR